MKRLTASAVLTLLVISSCGTGANTSSETSPSFQTVVITQPTTIIISTTTQPELNAHEALQEDLVEATSTTTTEVPLVADPHDYIDEQRILHGRCGEWHDLAIEVGWQEEEWPTLSTVLFTESRCTPNAFNGHDSGLTQINRIHTAWAAEMGFKWPEDLFDARNNLYFAYRLYTSREEKGLCGWKPWTEPCH